MLIIRMLKISSYYLFCECLENVWKLNSSYWQFEIWCSFWTLVPPEPQDRSGIFKFDFAFTELEDVIIQ